MKTGTKLFLGFVLAGALLTYVLPWFIELYKYQNRLVPPEEVVRTLEHIEKRIKEGCALPWLSASEEEFNQNLRDAKMQLTSKMLPIDVFKIIQPVLSVLNDQNIRFSVPTEPVYKVLPFSVTVVDRRVIVTSTADDSVPLGAEILAINGIKKEELIEEFLKYTSGECYELREQHLGTLIWLYPELSKKDRRFEVQVYRVPEKHTVTLKVDGEEKTVTVKTTTAYSFPKFVKDSAPRRGPFDFQIHGKIGILKLGTFSLREGMFNRYRDFLNGIFIQHPEMESLIIDVRGSAIRDLGVFKELLEHLVNHSITLDLKMNVVHTAYNLSTLEKLGIPFSSSTGELLTAPLKLELTPREPIFKGKVYVLADRYTTQTSFDFLIFFHKLKRGKIIGEIPVTPVNHSAEVSSSYSPPMMMSYFYPTARVAEPKDALKFDAVFEMNTEERINYILGKSDILLERAIEFVNKDH
ncbi:S41 family peptidase [Fervidobacterium thailandense]|uniref:Uncharacterized protein n=1 Tax=Fervidobacterium thailandense TaxID=1008305 RepID=A0A1E3G3A5_9BACT|nr:S41 family peptidase [Fervidobacterium thailandense]ODN30734.1 hypothetical protein A4H02_04185 [Fervidobacterium thailandense]